MYRQKDIDIISENIDEISSEANKSYHEKFEPKYSEIKNLFKIILNYVKENKYIIYGGYAQNELIKQKNKDDTFYSDDDIIDIEVYSPEPLKMLINLSDKLNNMEFKYIEGKEGVHIGTYKLFVNFINYLDITYIPKNIFNKMPIVEIDGIKFTHPFIMYIDTYRVFCDPMTSYFRLKKTFDRFLKIVKNYPFDENSSFNKIEYEINLTENEYNDINNFIRKKLLQKMKLILVGFHAYNRLIEKSNMEKNNLINEPYYQIISTNYKEDKKYIFNLLRNKFGNNISKKEYQPFFEFLDYTTEIYYKNSLILKLFGNNNRCIVYKFSEKKKIHYGTFQLQILYLLSNYLLSDIRNNTFDKKVYLTMVIRLLKARNLYLDRKNLNIIDESPFQSFTIKCIGKAVDSIRSSLLDGLERKKKNKPMKFIYRPKKNIPGNIPNFKFPNISGNIIIN